MTSRTLPLALGPARGARWVSAPAAILAAGVLAGPGDSPWLRLWPSLAVLAACALQLWRPTWLGWALAFTAFTACSSLVLSHPGPSPFADYLACAVLGIGPGALLLLTGPARAGG